MTAPQPYPGDPGTEGLEVVPTGPNVQRLYANYPGRLIVIPEFGPSFEVAILDGTVSVDLEPGHYSLVAVLEAEDGRTFYQTEVVDL